MSDPKPDRILAEESDNPWVKLILWSNEDPLDPTYRWNGFMKYLVEERLSTLKDLNLSDQQRRKSLELYSADSAGFAQALPLHRREIVIAQSQFSQDTDFMEVLFSGITFDNHIFSSPLNFRHAVFVRAINFENSISFKNCRFEGSVDFSHANLEPGAVFSDSDFVENVSFEAAKFRDPVEFERVIFNQKVNFYWPKNDRILDTRFRDAHFLNFIPVSHGRNFHPASDFHGVTWPKIPKRNGDKKTEDAIEDALLDQITCYEFIRTQAENIGQLELRKEMIRRELACRAELAEPSFERLLRKAYGWICDHGTSIGRPALALLCIWGFTFLAWQGWATQEAAVTNWDVLYHTGGRMLPFVGGHADVEEHTLKALRAAPHVLHFLSAMAAILSPFLLFLMALALRLKFRMSV